MTKLPDPPQQHLPPGMTSYGKDNQEYVAEVDPAFGVQLHHPCFLECIGVPELGYWVIPRQNGSGR